jgi:hypothetical protein
VIAWAVHDVTPEAAEDMRRHLQHLPELASAKVVMKTFSHRDQTEFGFKDKPTAYVFLIDRRSNAQASGG